MKSYKGLTAALLGAMALSGCHWFDDDHTTQLAPEVDPPPSAEILFPSRTGFTPADTFQVRGSASDDQTVASVRVNGVLAESTDQFQNWTVEVPLDYGSNTLSVDVTDDGGNQVVDAASVVVERRSEIRRPFGTQVDAASNTLYYVDIDLHKIMTLDLTNGDVQMFADLSQFDPIGLGRPALDIALDLPNDRVFLTVRDTNVTVAGDASIGVWELDTLAGTWSAFSDSTIDPASVFSNPSDLALDSANNRLLVVDYDLDAVVAVNLTTGIQSILSSNTVPNAAVNVFGEILDAALDSAGNRLLLVDRIADALISVDLTTGNRTLVSGAGAGSGTALSQPLAVAYDAPNNRALVFDRSGTRGIIAVDLATGERSVFARSFDDSEGRWLIDVRALAISGGELIAIDNNYDHALAFDLSTAERRILSNNGFPRGEVTGALYGNQKIGDDFYGHTYNSIARVNAQNEFEVLAGDIEGGPTAIRLNHLTVTPSADMAYTVGWVFENNLVQYRVQTIDLATGAVTTLSDNATPNTDNPILSGRGIAFDATSNSIYVLETDRILVVDASTGARTVLADDGSFPYVSPNTLTFDAANGRFLVTDNGYEHLIAIDSTTGARSAFANTMVGAENFVEHLFAMAVTDNGPIYAVDGNNRLVTVDPTSGARAIVVNINDFGVEYPGYWEELTHGNGLIYAKAYEGLIEIDPDTGELLIVYATTASAPGNNT